MRVFLTKLPDKDAERFIEACKKVGKSYYQVLRELIYRWLSEQGYEANDNSYETKIVALETRVKELESTIKSFNDRLEKVEKQLQQLLERINRGSLYGFVKGGR